MKLIYKIVLVNFAIAFGLALIGAFSNGTSTSRSDFAVIVGMACLGIAILDLLFGFLMLLSSHREWAKGMLLSGAVLLLLSGVCCSSGFGGYH